MQFGNFPDLKTEQEAVQHSKNTLGISIKGSFGKKNNCIGIDAKTKLPSLFEKNAIQAFHNELGKINKEKNRITNLDSILKVVGKKGTAEDTNQKMPAVMNGMDMMKFMMKPLKEIIYPTLDDIKTARPDIYSKYEGMSDGTKLITFHPGHKECDEWGFLIEPVLLISKRDDELRYVTETWGIHYLIRNNKRIWGGALSGVEKAFAANEGCSFRGWKNTKQYRLTKAEISTELKGKILEDGGILGINEK